MSLSTMKLNLLKMVALPKPFDRCGHVCPAVYDMQWSSSRFDMQQEMERPSVSLAEPWGRNVNRRTQRASRMGWAKAHRERRTNPDCMEPIIAGRDLRK